MLTSQGRKVFIAEMSSGMNAATVIEGEVVSRDSLSGRWGAATHRGHTRARNEDTILAEPDLGLYAVLDGMGGAASGDVASHLAARSLASFVRESPDSGKHRPTDLLRAAIESAAIAVYDLAHDITEHQGMGTTVVACLLGPARRISIAHAGDSRAYLLRGQRMCQLTCDHTVWQQYLNEGRVLPPETAAFFKTVLTRNLGEEHGVAAEVLEETLEAGDRLLLCSDGLNDALPDEAIQHVLASREAPSHIARRLIEAALAGECRDNISALVLNVAE